ncbi:unnamed protein product [Penicillium egyptiacum]|uniref:F-box domain-containing protein n=1 Tax=Penicillium egyptiacum TaxID=1303716 RepID=A0A9W4P6H6_9EURO|nr:unnamed protein product [Penicillium egyptiacum]
MPRHISLPPAIHSSPKKMSIEILPTELILLIASVLPCESSLVALALSNRRLYEICNPFLYQYNVLHGHSSALNWAAENDRIDTLQKALDAGAPLLMGRPLNEDPSLFKPHPLSLAAKKGHTNIVRYMVDRGVSPDITTRELLTPLALAAARGHASLVTYLLQVGARQGIKDARGRRPVFLAASQGHTEVVELLLSAPKELGNKPDKEELMTEAFLAAVQAEQVPVVQLLFAHGAQLNIGFGWCPLTVAANNGNSDLAALLLAHGADPNFIEEGQVWAPLTVAVANDHKEISQMLVHGTACLHRTRALAIAVKRWNRPIAEMLLRCGAPPQFCPSEVLNLPDGIPGNDGQWVQPLLFAVESGNLELAQLLLEYGADVNVACFEHPGGERDKDFNRVLFCAVEKSDETMVNLLLEHGADPRITDLYSQSPLSYAVYSNCEAIVRSLLDHGANPYRAVDHCDRKLIMFWQMNQSIWAMLQEAEVKWTEQHSC